MFHGAIIILVLITGLLFLTIGLAPIVSRKVFKTADKLLWKDDNPSWSKKEAYFINRYWGQLWLLVVGAVLVMYALYKFFFD